MVIGLDAAEVSLVERYMAERTSPGWAPVWLYRSPARATTSASRD